jgi:hypothetical protein
VAGPYTWVGGHPPRCGGGGRGFNGGQPAVSAGISYSAEIEDLATEEELQALVRQVDETAEIPNSLRVGTEIRLGNVIVRSRGRAPGRALTATCSDRQAGHRTAGSASRSAVIPWPAAWPRGTQRRSRARSAVGADRDHRSGSRPS